MSRITLEITLDTDDREKAQAILDNMVESLSYYDPTDFGVETMIVVKAEVTA